MIAFLIGAVMSCMSVHYLWNHEWLLGLGTGTVAVIAFIVWITSAMLNAAGEAVALGVEIVRALLSWAQISDWFQTSKVNLDDVGTLLKQRMQNGSVRVVAGVFNNHSQQLAAVQWDNCQLDAQTEAAFAGADQITVQI